MAFSTFSTLSRFNGSAAKTTPYNLSVVTTNPYDITVSFNAPTTFTPAYYYAITGGGIKSYGTSSPITVGGLAASTGYTIRIVAVNAVGTLFTSTSSVTVTTPALVSGVYSTAGTIAYLPLNNDILNYSSGTGVPFVGTGNANIVFASTPSGLPAGYANICLYNDGTSGIGYVKLSFNSPLNNNFQFPANNVSYSFWFRSAVTTNNYFGAIFQFIVGAPGGGNVDRVCMFIDTDSTNTLIKFTASTAGEDAITSFSYSNNTWYHIVWTISATGNFIIYVNGSNVVSVDSGVTDKPTAATTYNYLFTENEDGGSKTKGYLSDFRVYNSVLSSIQVNNIYSSSSVTLNAPTIGSATSITTTSAVVSFTAPSGVATGTTYDASAAGVIYGASAYPATSIYLGGLTSNTLYNMAVAATNNYGRSSYSSTVAVTTVPSAPTALTFIGATASSVTFSFTAPTGAGTITGYTPYVNGVSGTGSGTPSSYTVTGLTSGTTYSIGITATNAGGTSAQSSSVNMTTSVKLAALLNGNLILGSPYLNNTTALTVTSSSPYYTLNTNGFPNNWTVSGSNFSLGASASGYSAVFNYAAGGINPVNGYMMYQQYFNTSGNTCLQQAFTINTGYTYTLSMVVQPRVTYYNVAHKVSAAIGSTVVIPAFSPTNSTPVTGTFTVPANGTYTLYIYMYCTVTNYDTSIGISAINIT